MILHYGSCVVSWVLLECLQVIDNLIIYIETVGEECNAFIVFEVEFRNAGCAFKKCAFENFIRQNLCIRAFTYFHSHLKFETFHFPMIDCGAISYLFGDIKYKYTNRSQNYIIKILRLEW